jgi:hypothetical protein
MAKVDDAVAAARAQIEAEKQQWMEDYAASKAEQEMLEIADRLPDAERDAWLAQPEQREKLAQGERARVRNAQRQARQAEREARQAERRDRQAARRAAE